MVMASGGCLALLAVFTGGLMDSQAIELFVDYADEPFHLSALVFGGLQTLWWGGCGILVPLAVSMIADLSALKKMKTGEVTEGRYASGFSFFLKAASALGMFVTGYILKGVGYVSGAEIQSTDTLEKLALMTFIIGLSHSISTGFAGFSGGLPFMVIAIIVICMALYDFWEDAIRKTR